MKLSLLPALTPNYQGYKNKTRTEMKKIIRVIHFSLFYLRATNHLDYRWTFLAFHPVTFINPAHFIPIAILARLALTLLLMSYCLSLVIRYFLHLD